MFGLFSRKKLPYNRLNDLVFMKRVAADAAVIADAERLKPAAVICFFDETLERLKAAAPGLNYYKADKLVRDLAARGAVRSYGTLLFAEHHPSSIAEEEVLNELGGIFQDRSPDVGFYVGLDEPMMQVFGGANVTALMIRMGVKETEAISHKMVSGAIQNAQQKIAKKTGAGMAASSQQQWLDLNFAGK